MNPVSLGPEVVKSLIAQRPPMLWLDRITAVRFGDRPALHGCRHLSANEPVFGGHFPRLALMPGVLAIEGLAQAAEALAALLALRDAYDGDAPLLDDLRNAEWGATWDPRFDPERHAAFRARVTHPERPPSVAGSAKVKFVRPVFPGHRLDYQVTLRRRMDHTAHFELEAAVGGDPVVRGSFTTALLEGRSWPG